MLLPLIGIHGV